MRKRVVIFDDEEMIRTLLWQFFDKRDYEVFTFPCPDLCPLHVTSECLCPLGTACSDLIISDVNMLGQNGLEYIEKLMHKGCRQRHFALMSGGFTDVAREQASRLGCVLFEKPLDFGALAAWVEGVEQSIPAERVLFNWTNVG